MSTEATNKIVITENPERDKLIAFLLYVTQRDEFGNCLVDYCGYDLCPTFKDALEMFEADYINHQPSTINHV